MSKIPPFPGDQNYNPVTRRFLERVGVDKSSFDVQIANLQATDQNLQNEILAIESDITGINTDIADINSGITNINNSILSLDNKYPGFYCFAGSKALTESSATSIAEISLPQGESIGGNFEYTIKASDGTDLQVLNGSLRFVAVNKAGTITIPTGTTGSEDAACSSGTLVNSATFSTGTNKIVINLNAVSSLTQTSLTANWRIFWHGSATSVTPL